MELREIRHSVATEDKDVVIARQKDRIQKLEGTVERVQQEIKSIT